MRPPFLRAPIFAVALLAGSMATPVLAQDQPLPGASDSVASADPLPRDPTEIYSDLNFLGEVFDRIRAEYVDKPDERNLVRAAVQGMLTSLDPHSSYLDPESYKDVQEGTSGEFGGLGIQVTMEEGVIKVVSPIDDTPAAKAGILPNDYIIELDNAQVQGMTLDEAVEKMKGAPGSKIKLTIIREGADKPLTFELTRAIIAMQAVTWNLDRDVGIMRLSTFSEQAYSGIETAVKRMFTERNGNPPKGLILDLRNNPGGLVDQAVLVSDAFLNGGSVVLTRGRSETESARYDASPDDLDRMIAKVPLVVLINGGSASAAEIVAGALQDHKRATLVGTRSFGKGSVQSIVSLGANGAMRLTTARYYTPNNRSIQAAGIHPDIEIFQEVPAEFQGRDQIVGEAALRGQIGGGTEEEATTGSSVYVPRDKTQDKQLNYAIALVLGEEHSDAYPPNPQG